MTPARPLVPAAGTVTLPILHLVSQRALEAALQSQAQALLVSGPSGIGLSTVINYYAQSSGAAISTLLPQKNDSIDLEKGVIAISDIRGLYDLTRTVEPKGRMVIIDYAERMGIPAQNAFLKLLEEPTAGTQFILLSHEPERLLPTILSRVQQVALRPISAEQSETLLNDLKVTNPTTRTQLLFIAAGLPAELTRLASDSAHFETRATAVKDARQFISGSPYDRLVLAKKYKDSRSDALTLLDDAMKQLRQSLAQQEQKQGQARPGSAKTSSSQPHASQADTLHVLTQLQSLHERIANQGNIRLQLSAATALGVL